MGDYKTTRLIDYCALDRIWSSTQRLEDLEWFGLEMPYVQYGGWCSCYIALEPGCSKFRGELTSWSSSVEPVRVQPTLSYVGGLPFYSSRWGPIYSYLALCLCTVGAQIVLVSRRGPLSRSGVGELDPGDLLVQGMILAISLSSVSPWLSRGGATTRSVTRGSPSVLSAGA